MKLTPGNWNIGPRTAPYEAVGHSGFDAISIGNEHAQVALVPCDNPHAADNARVLARAADMHDLVIGMARLAQSMAEQPLVEGEAMAKRSEELVRLLFEALALRGAIQEQRCPT